MRMQGIMVDVFIKTDIIPTTLTWSPIKPFFLILLDVLVDVMIFYRIKFAFDTKNTNPLRNVICCVTNTNIIFNLNELSVCM